ncbi:MAG: hypothetical protein ABIG30_01345, partial [Candidatus Aenigmatarchaeota archaeon]
NVNKTLIMAGLVDDGNRAMNVVLFNNAVEQLLGKLRPEIENELAQMNVTEFVNQIGIVGKKYKVCGRIRNNKTTQEPEVRVDKIEQI